MDLLEAVTSLGFPTAVAIFLIWWTTSHLAKKLDELGERMEQHASAIMLLATVVARDKNIDFQEIEEIVRRG